MLLYSFLFSNYYIVFITTKSGSEIFLKKKEKKRKKKKKKRKKIERESGSEIALNNKFGSEIMKHTSLYVILKSFIFK